MYLGKHTTIGIDYGRILNTVEKTIRGLFFKHTGQPLPKDHTVFRHLLPKVGKATSDKSRTLLNELVELLLTMPVVSIGPQVFRYKYCIEEKKS
ncbi:hypothetical protein GobsT_18340 [Gemmata obscuriglobus]|uniref:hypothetical protein n=1 Tax=Gemmata obscuriglobus TaxID=114 RepID=UPI0011CD10FB|nr:hypothetical protein [Gemmata obscuriglobus]QEG27081.1 hypothetical protein GobsT_18340 [Gemmata obscuriglobus]VTS03538.1 unnamed protein product [Gemmata obscuriglobus UQM 2246]